MAVIYPFGQGQTMPSGYPIADDLNTDSSQQALSAKQGKRLKDNADALSTIVGDVGALTLGADIISAIEENGYVDVGVNTYTEAQAKTAFQDASLNKKWLVAQTGDVPQYQSDVASTAYVLRIPLTGIATIKYPMFNTTSGFGSVICNDENIVVWAFANYADEDGTVKVVDVSEISGASYALVQLYDAITGYTIETISTEHFREKTAEAVKNLIMGSGQYQSDDYNIMGRGFVDFGTMPSCLATDADNFLPAGVSASETDSNGNPAALVSYADVIAKYDALVSAYPAYVQKHSFGNDASGTIPMYYYTFKPKYYVQHVYLQAGVHGWEPDPVFALAEIMYLIANAYGGNLSPKIADKNELTYLRGNVAFTVVPCVNPWGFNHRSDCAIDKRNYAQNNYNGVQLNAAWSGSATEAVYVRTLLDSIASELSFAIDMHSTVWNNTRTKYGCFYGGFNSNGKNVRTIWRTYEWLYEFYGVKYPNIVDGDTCPNVIGNYASVGILTGCFHDWCLDRYGVQAGTMEFSDHVWSDDDSTNYPKPLHTSAAMSVAVNMYLNHILQQVYDGYRVIGETNVPSTDKLPTIG